MWFKSPFCPRSGRFRSLRKKFNLLPREVAHEFKHSLDCIVNKVCENKTYLNISGIKETILQISQYNVRIAKNPSSSIMLHAHNNLEGAKNLPSERAFIMAWSIEILQSHRMLSACYKSEIEDPFWKVRENEMSAINQANIIRCFLYELLTYYFKGQEIHTEVLQLYNKAFISSAILEYSTKGIHKPFNFSWKQHEVICEYETSCITFEVPLLLAIKLALIDGKILYDHIHKICLDLGKLCQIQDEYDNCFGDDSNRTSGTHIQEGKCTWLAVTALEHCTPAQRVVFNACYGSTEPAHVERIKYLYEQLKIPKLYREQIGYLTECVTKTAEILNNNGLPSKIFFDLIDALCEEKK
ncbi:hypothetical protein ACJJTC_003212 [Scirpophaga incertulas]